jgi:hypothetical protein
VKEQMDAAVKTAREAGGFISLPNSRMSPIELRSGNWLAPKP